MGPETFPHTVALRDGTPVTLLPLKPRDMADLQAFYRSFPEEERTVFRDDITTPAWALRFQQRLETGEVVSLIAVHKEELVGEATLYRTFHGWTRHVGELRIACRQGFRRKGLGMHLTGALVAIATDLGIEKLMVQVVETQLGARRTFEKLGFKKEAVFPRHVMDLNGVKRDLIVLGNDVPHVWAALEALQTELSPLL